MTITELIENLQIILSQHGDIPVQTEDYAGGDYYMNDPTLSVIEDPVSLGPTLILNR